MNAGSEGGAVLVTGAGGLIGHHVVESLRLAGRKVVAADRMTTDLDAPAATLEIGDIHGLYRAVDAHDVASIVHCGGISGPMLGRDNPARLIGLNVSGTLDIAEVARYLVRRNGACRVVFCSSLSVYGDQPDDGITEDAPTLTRGVYGASKIAAEAILRAYAAEHGVESASLRITWVYGPRRTTDCVIRTMIDDALAGRPTRLPYGRDFRRQFVHVLDVVQAIRLALDAPRLDHLVYNVSGGVKPTLGDVADIVRSCLPEADITLADGPDPVDNTLGRVDISRIGDELGFRPSVGLREGIAGYAGWLRLQKAGTTA